MTYKALSLDLTTHDLEITNNSLVIVTDARAVAQRVKQHLRLFAGEWFLNTESGVPWIEFVFTKPFDQATAEAVIKDAIMRVPGVVEITSFAMDFRPERRQADVYDLRIRTEFDEEVLVNV